MLELMQGDVLITVILPLVWSLISVIMLFLSRVLARDGVLRGLTVFLYSFVLFPAIWISGHGFEGPVVLYFLLILAMMVILIDRMAVLIPSTGLFLALVVFLIFWEPEGFELNRQYAFAYERQFDFIFNILFTGIMMIAIVRVLHNRIANLESELEKSKTQDSLTGLYNRKRILELLKAEQLRCSRERSDLAVVVLSVANYSQAVRTLGHHSGEVLLKKVAYIIRNKSRLYDYIGRVHVNGFLCVLPGSSQADGAEYVRRISDEPDLFEPAFLDKGVQIRGDVVEVSNMSYEDVVNRADTMFKDVV